MNLLESAGFSRANPYYIVQQGKVCNMTRNCHKCAMLAADGVTDSITLASRAQIAALSTMKDSQRLALLKEVGGTKIYEERRHDSLKLMAESEGRSQRIQEVVRRASNPLSTLVSTFCCTLTGDLHIRI